MLPFCEGGSFSLESFRLTSCGSLSPPTGRRERKPVDGVRSARWAQSHGQTRQQGEHRIMSTDCMCCFFCFSFFGGASVVDEKAYRISRFLAWDGGFRTSCRGMSACLLEGFFLPESPRIGKRGKIIGRRGAALSARFLKRVQRQRWECPAGRRW